MTAMPPQPRIAETPTQVADVTCLACGCLCDDVVLTVSGNRIVEARNGCERGRAWFLAEHGEGDTPAATAGGQPCSREEAVAHAGEILSAARAPLVLGLTGATIEAQAAAIALADRLRAVIVPAHAGEASARMRAFQRVGRVSATLGEVKNRADVIVFWGVDPVTTHPRHMERYSADSRGRFVPEGRAGRTVIVADAERTATAGRADLFLPVRPEAQLATLWCLRALVHEVDLDPDDVQRTTGLALNVLREFAGHLLRARYGAFFTGATLARPTGGTAVVEAALTLVRDLNDRHSGRRFVILPLGGPGNEAGAEAALSWQTGFPLGADFRRGYPRAVDDPSGLRGDAVLVVGSDVPEPMRQALAGVPTVVIAPGATAIQPAPSVALASATSGIHEAGTVIRCDGQPLPLRPALTTPLPTAEDLLDQIANQL